VTYIIAEPCIDIKDLSCVDVCPVDCIHTYDRMLIIDPEECIDCGACEPECPVNAIFEASAVPPEWHEFIELDQRWSTGTEDDKNAVRARINEIQPPAG
jgi:ferredoxin